MLVSTSLGICVTILPSRCLVAVLAENDIRLQPGGPALVGRFDVLPEQIGLLVDGYLQRYLKQRAVALGLFVQAFAQVSLGVRNDMVNPG